MKEIRLRIFGEAVIEVGDTQVTPTSSHIFALLLLLTLGPKEGWTRRELMEMLFEGVEAKEASHRLRQLLYKLRGMGVELGEQRGGLGVRAANAMATSTDVNEQTLLSAPTKVVLAKYDPELPPPFREWIDSKRDAINAQVRDSAARLLQRAKKSGDWLLTARLAESLRELDPYSSEAICVGAEALALTGRRNQALRLLDDLCADNARDAERLAEARRLRARISKTDFSQHEIPLIGREECLAFVARCWQSAVSSGPHVCTLIGAAGIGKTRIAANISTQIQVSGGNALLFTCNPDMQDNPYAFFSYALERLIAQPGGIGISPEYRSALDALRRRPEDADPIGDRSVAAQRRSLLQQALLDLLDSVSTERALAVIIDDAHWMDDASRRIFDLLCHSPEQVRLLVVLLRRPDSNGSSYTPIASRVSTYLIPVLNVAQSRALITALQPDTTRADESCEWILERSAGNPFYLCMLARAARSGMTQTPSPIQSIAATYYYGLDEDSRSLLETCLLLDGYASLPRIEAVTGLQTSSLLKCLRTLEHAALASFEAGIIQGPHAILKEALRALIPGSVAALLRRAIARLLTEEVARTFEPALAVAAVRSLLAVADPGEALALARSCAKRASLLGEPAASARILIELERHPLPSESRTVLLEDLIAYAESAGLREISSRALDDRIALAKALGESRSVVTDLRLRTVSSAFRGPRIVPSVPPLQDIVEDSSLPASLRNRAAARILTVAYLHYDVELAAYGHTRIVRGHSSCDDLPEVMARLIFHSTFGDALEARRLVSSLLERYPTPSLDRENREVWINTAFALTHLGLRDEAASITIANHAFMHPLGLTRDMEYTAGLLGEIMIGMGDYDAARIWIAREREAADKHREAASTYSACYHSNIVMLALHDGDARLAVDTLARFSSSYASSETPRFQAVTLALGIRSALLEDAPLSTDSLQTLERLFQSGKQLGGQDGIVEALCLAYRSIGRSAEALALVSHYTQECRRELGPLEAGLRLAISSFL